MTKSLHYILTIAGAERVMLYRTAKFWVLGGIGALMILFFMVVMTVATIIDNSIPGEFLLEGTDGFLALYFFSYVQAILIIFVAGDFRKAEEKARLDQVMLSRPMTTANLVVGKYFGVVGALVYFNLFLMAFAAIGRMFKVIFTGAGFNVFPFIKYFFIGSLPSILFMTARVFVLVSLLRSPALAIILPLGYVASILFYFHHKFQGLFDYGAFFAPLFYSDLIGFGEIPTVLWQRLFFTLLAFSLLSFSIILYPRLQQSIFSHRLAQASAIVFLLAAAAVGHKIVDEQHDKQQTRQNDLTYQQQWISQPACQVKHYDLEVTLDGKAAPLQVTTGLGVFNPHTQPLAQLIFALNGALHVTEARWQDGNTMVFRQEHQVLHLDLANRPLQPGATDTVHIVYAGAIDADGFMLDRLPENENVIIKNDGPFVKDNISAYLSNNFAVLPAQCGWYPIPGAAAGYAYESPRPQNFATAKIRVRAGKNLTIITQGEKLEASREGEKITTTFIVSSPVPALSLNAGVYKSLQRKFKQTQVEFYFRDKHLLDYDIFSEVADTCFQAVERLFEILEETTGVPFPYQRLALIEVPAQMQVYATRHGFDNILLQPGVVMIDEVMIAARRLKKQVDERTKRMRRRGQDDSPARIKRDVFIGAVLDVFMDDEYWHGDGSFRSLLRNYFHFQLDLADPVFSRAVELQLHEECERRAQDTFYPDRWNAHLSANDRIRQLQDDWVTRWLYGVEMDTVLAALEKMPLAKLRPEGKGNLYRVCVDLKAPPILKMLRERVGEKNYLAALRQLLQEYRYRQVSIADFLNVVQSSAKDDLRDFFQQWFEQATFPGYRITAAEAEKLDTGRMRIVHQVKVRVQNGERGDGYVRLVCETENDKIRRNLALGSYEEKEIRFPVIEVPKNIQIYPYFSRNRGEIMKQITLSNRIRRGAPQDTVFATTTSLSDSLSFVLDDQDEGFFTPVREEAKYLRPRSKGQSWWEDTNPFAYGKYYFGWRVKRDGSGEYPARWEIKVPRSGDYELSFHLPVGKDWRTERLSRRFEIKVTSAEGTNRLELQPQETVDDWLPLGRYRFDREKTAVIELSDKGSGYVIADAVRWEFVE
jgi:ABC-type transport system involved in multi-copper enzyme maturation permease subunit